MSLADQIKNIARGEILEDNQTLASYSIDASIYEIKPRLVIYPKDEKDIKSLVQFINSQEDETLSITPRLAGTDMSGGAINDSIILDMTKYFNKIKIVGEDYAIVQPGVYYKDFEVETLEKNLLLPCFTASKDICTVGGMVANNSAGEKTLLFGQTDKYVRRLKVILSDGKEYEFKPIIKSELDKKINQNDFEGEVYRRIYRLITENQNLIENAKPTVSKNSAGYYLWNVWDGEVFDMCKLFVGSQGTLGVVTEIEFQLITPKKESALLVVALHNLDNLDQVVNEVLKFNPEAFECYDDQTILYSVRYLSELIEHFRFSYPLSVYWQFLPEFMLTFLNKLPKLTLLAQFTGESKDEALQKCESAKEDLNKLGLKSKTILNNKQAEKYWVIRHESFNLLRHHASHMRTAPFIDDFVVSPKVLPEFLPKMKIIMEQYKNIMLYTIAGHIGDGNFHIIPLVDLSKEEVRQAIPQLSQKIYNLVLEYKGSITGEHNDGLVRGPFLEQMYGKEVYQLFKEVKSIFDPKNIFNPHKKVDATFDYSFKHLASK